MGIQVISTLIKGKVTVKIQQVLRVFVLKDRVFYREDTLGISNEIVAEEATVTFSNGMFLVVESKDK